MLRILDRYTLREIVPTFSLGLGVFTFVFLLNEILRYAQILVTQGASLRHVLAILANLLPSVLCLTIPMGVLLGILIALGRLAADSEITALRASGVSLYGLLRPILVAAFVAWAATSYLIINVLPDSNQAVRTLVFQVIASNARTDIRPRVFYDTLFPNFMFLIMDTPSGTRDWSDIFLADVTSPTAPRITLAKSGQLVVDSDKRTVNFYLRDGEAHQVTYNHPGEYDLQTFSETVLPLANETFFPPENTNVPRGAREMGVGQLYDSYRESSLPVYLVEIHKKFSIPFACFVFAILGLALGIRNRREGRSWGFVVSIAVIFIYYVLIQLGDGMATQGNLSPWLAMWVPNLVLGVAGVALLKRHAREAAPALPDIGRRVAAALGKLRRGGRLRKGAPTASGSDDRAIRRATRPVVVIRIPRMVIRFPNTLDRYVSREFFRYFLLVLSALVVVYILGLLVDVIPSAVENRTRGDLVLSYIGNELPQVFLHMLPLATLMATLINFALLSKTSELVAAKAGGVSMYRLAIPVTVIGFVVSLSCFAIQEYLVPYTNRRAAELLDEIKNRPVQTHNILNRRWMLGQGERIYNYAYYDPPQRIFSGLAVYDFDRERFSLTERFYAQTAVWDPSSSSWLLRDGWIRRFDEPAGIERFEERHLQSMEPPDYFTKERRESSQMTYLELDRYIDELSQSGFDVVRLEVALHSKVSFPLAALITLLIGVPFSFSPGKKGALYGIGIAIVVGLTYYVTTRVFAFMGDSAILPPLMAAWAPNVLFGIAALYALFTVKT
ncbi:MAG TPA: LPS export ABC transporter permease LptF [Vicinamibacteria bacterium]|jgi:LPS export ABC transporter permease LptF/LPS export ABC transporter permease LptG